MKEYKTIYMEDSIAYWPFHEAGIVGLIFLSILGGAYLVMAVWSLIDYCTMGTGLWVMITALIVIILSWKSYRYIFERIYVKFVVSNAGIECWKKNDVLECKVDWDDISAVYFAKRAYRGIPICKIIVKKDIPQMFLKISECTFLLPAQSVNEHQLLEFIPKYLWKNDPWYIWELFLEK